MHDEPSPSIVAHADHDLIEFHQRAVQHATANRRVSRMQTLLVRALRVGRNGRTAARAIPRRYVLHGLVLLVLLIAVVIGRRPSLTTAGDSAPAGPLVAINPDRPFLGAQVIPGTIIDPTPRDLPVSPEWRLPDIAVSTRNEATLKSSTPDAAPARLGGRVIVEKANLRTGPGTNYDRQTVLEQGTDITLLSRYGSWLEVETATGRGWIAAEVLDVSDDIVAAVPVAMTIPEPPPALVAEVAADTLNLRDGPSTEYVGMTKLPRGTALDLLVRSQEWFRVQTHDGVAGWVTGEFLAMQPGVAERVPVAETIPPVNPDLVGTVTDTGVNLRNGPAKGHESLGILQAGTEVTIAARYDSWYKVTTPRGTTGWMAREFVDVSAFIQRRIPLTNDVPALPEPKPAPSQPAPRQEVPVAAAPPPAPPAAGSGGVVAFALQFQGYPYVWGAAGPNAFDCSGFTQYVYKHFGLNLPHSAAAQYSAHYGTFITSRESLAPGDLVFFANTYKPGISHVGIYIGDGQVIQAMSPGLGVGIAGVYGPYWGERFYGAVRP